MFVNAKRFTKGANKSQEADLKHLRFYYKDIERFVSHPFILSELKQKVHTVEKSQVSVNKSFYNLAEMLELFERLNPELAGCIFNPFSKTSRLRPATY